MKRRIVLFLLAVSLAFNALFVLGFLKARRNLTLLRTPEGRAELLIDRLELTPQQERRYARLRRELTAEVSRIDEQHGFDALTDQFWAEVDREPPDAVRLHDMRALSLGWQNEVAHHRLDHFLELLELLDPDQREELFSLVRRENHGF